MIVCVDGNDGTGKTTLITHIQQLFPEIEFQDRGLPTAMTDGQTAAEADLYLILDAPVETCQSRLLKAGRSITEQYHTREDLLEYQVRFLKVAGQLNAVVINAEGPLDQIIETASDAIKVLINPEPSL